MFLLDENRGLMVGLEVETNENGDDGFFFGVPQCDWGGPKGESWRVFITWNALDGDSRHPVAMEMNRSNMLRSLFFGLGGHNQRNSKRAGHTDLLFETRTSQDDGEHRS